jgi:exopolysaccharide biosynthesis protein
LPIAELPPSIQVFEGDAVNADGLPVRAWYATVDYNDRALQARAVLSGAESGRESTSLLARAAGALVAVNGGYFSMKPTPRPAPTLSLVISNGRVLASNVETASRANGKYFLTRGAFGVRPDRSLDVAWVAQLPRAGGPVWSFPTPLPNTYAAPAPPPTETFPLGASTWDATEAIGGAPVLIEHGQVRITAEPEAIGREMSHKRHPRTLVGWAGGNRMILLVSDGRQPNWSAGQTLDEAAIVMRDLGCVEALNLDGGGSSTFVVANRVLNRPSDGSERGVTSIWAVVSAPRN